MTAVNAGQSSTELQRTAVSQRVVTLRQRLLRAGVTVSYLDPSEVNDPSFFDDHVDAAVRAFQQSRGLIVDGIVGRETERSLSEAQFKLGDRPLAYSESGGTRTRGDDVAELQRQLSHLGFFYGHIDGEFGTPTQAALRELQANVGLDPTGVCDGATISALTRINRSLSPSQAFSLRDYERLSQASAALSGRVIALDPAVASDVPKGVLDGDEMTEGSITLDIARRVASILERFGASVVLTRDEDEVFTLADRIERIRESGASLAIAVHCDWMANPTASGASGFYWGLPESNEIRSPIGERIAHLLQREVVARTGMVDLGVHPRSWDILRSSHVPSVQLELGYLSNEEDAFKLRTPVFRQILADAVVIGIQRLYLVEEDDHPTGSMAVDDVSRLNQL